MTRTQQSIIRWMAAMVVVGLFVALGARSSALSVVVGRAMGQEARTTSGPVRFSVVFSEPVQGFSAADVELTPSATMATTDGLTATVTGWGSTYVVTVDGLTGSGTLTASVPAGSAFDAGGRRNTASTSTTGMVAFDRPPTLDSLAHL
jgi:methionine-rich copper-binding protein CopC